MMGLLSLLVMWYAASTGTITSKRERDTDRQTETDRQGERDRDRQTQTDRQGERERERERDYVVTIGLFTCFGHEATVPDDSA